MITIQNQNFGVEIELTGITRQVAAQVIADYYGTIGTRFMGTVYKTYEAVDNKGRRWKCMRDASITPQRRVNGHVVDANDEYKCEVVTPILQYEDISDLQRINFPLQGAAKLKTSPSQFFFFMLYHSSQFLLAHLHYICQMLFRLFGDRKALRAVVIE